MKYIITITHNNGRRSLSIKEDVPILELMHYLEKCYFKSFSIRLAP